MNVAREQGMHTVELNLDPGETSSLFDESIPGPASTVVPAFVRRLLEEAERG